MLKLFAMALGAMFISLFSATTAEAHAPWKHPAGELKAPIAHHIAYKRSQTDEVRRDKCLPQLKRTFVPAYTIPVQLRPYTLRREKSRLESALGSGSKCLPTTTVGIGKYLAAGYGWSTGGEWNALYLLWNKESGWNHCRHYPSTTNCSYRGPSACGVPQANPCEKMCGGLTLAACGAWKQIKWGLRYIKSRWGTPSNAWRNSVCCNYY
jgi:hypothetical protein